MAIFGSVKTVRAQSPSSAAFAVAWGYIDELLRPGSPIHERVQALAAGASQKHELAGGVFAIEQAYETKPRSEGFFESHRRYIDIQVVVAGEETMEVVDVSRATVRDPYTDAKDLVVYADATGTTHLIVRAGEAAVFYPVDVHMPSLRSGSGPVLVRKSVLKVPVA